MTGRSERSALLDELAGRIAGLHPDRRLRVAVDDVDGAGKTTFADEFPPVLAAYRPVVRASVDGFHRRGAAAGPHLPAPRRAGWLVGPVNVPVRRFRGIGGAVRDRPAGSADPGEVANRRYVDGQRLYLAAARPAERADIVIDNTGLLRPVVIAGATVVAIAGHEPHSL